MKVFVSVDLEGVAGIVLAQQVRRGTSEYEQARRLMGAEANAAVVGAFDGGATGVLVSDAHADMANLVPADLDPRAELLIGAPRTPHGMMQALTDEFGVAILIGCHAGAGTPSAVLGHTFSGGVCHDVRLGATSVTEAELMAMLAAEHGVSIGLVVGDAAVCEIVEARMPGTRTLTVKRGVGATAARSLHPAEACRRIEAAVRELVADGPPSRPTPAVGPHRIELELATVGMAELCGLVPGTSRVDGRTVGYEAADISTCVRCLMAWIQLGRTRL